MCIWKTVFVVFHMARPFDVKVCSKLLSQHILKNTCAIIKRVGGFCICGDYIFVPNICPTWYVHLFVVLFYRLTAPLQIPYVKLLIHATAFCSFRMWHSQVVFTKQLYKSKASLIILIYSMISLPQTLKAQQTET